VSAPPWQRRFRAPAVERTGVAPLDPTRGYAITNASGVYQVHAWHVPSGQLRQLTHKPSGVVAAWVGADGRHVYFLDDAGGSEIGRYVRVPFEGGPAEAVTGDMGPYVSWGLAVARSGRLLAFSTVDGDGAHVHVVPLAPDGALGLPRRCFTSQRLTPGPFLTRDGDVAVVMSSERWAEPRFGLVSIDLETGAKLAELYDGDDASIEIMAASPLPGDPRFLAASDRSGTEALLIWNARTGERTDLSFEGVTGAARAFDWSPDGRRILHRTIAAAVQTLHISTLADGRTKHIASGGVHTLPYFTSDREIVSHFQDPSHPPHVVALDAETGAARTLLAAGDAPPGRPLSSVTFESSDGATIQGWLGLPDGPGPFPMILDVHGGPATFASRYYMPESQLWLDHGFGYLTINYRGSTTFGREFQQKIYGRPGHYELEDMVAARAFLVREGLARPDLVFVAGWSYGGYLTLFALGKRPELWAGGIAGTAIADWAALCEDAAETLKAYDAALFGGTPQEAPSRYAESSPITYAEHVRAPVLVLQGRNDTRTPARQIELYEAKMKSLGKRIDVHWFEAGHDGPFADVERGIAIYEVVLDWARRVMKEVG
jgi:dipeptidyl aminopeptidase/acylaminoacyl peptidase